MTAVTPAGADDVISSIGAMAEERTASDLRILDMKPSAGNHPAPAHQTESGKDLLGRRFLRRDRTINCARTDVRVNDYLRIAGGAGVSRKYGAVLGQFHACVRVWRERMGRRTPHIPKADSVPRRLK